MKLYIGILLGIFILYILYKKISYKKQKLKLGARILKLPNGIKNAESVTYAVVFLLCTVGAVWYPIRYTEITYEAYLFAAFMGLFSANAVYPLITASTEKGLYEQGIAAMAGVAPYCKFARYQIIKKKHGKMQVILFSRNKYFGKTFGFLTTEKDKKKVEKILKDKQIEKK